MLTMELEAARAELARQIYRSLVVHEHYKLIYYVDQKKELINIVAFWDTRREPLTLKKQIEINK